MQRVGNCPKCGYWDAFHHSWYSPEKEVAESQWVIDYDEQLVLLLEVFRDIIVEHEDGDWIYHITKDNRTIYRYPVSVHRIGFSPQESSGRKNYHIKGRNK